MVILPISATNLHGSNKTFKPPTCLKIVHKDLGLLSVAIVLSILAVSVTRKMAFLLTILILLQVIRSLYKRRLKTCLPSIKLTWFLTATCIVMRETILRMIRKEHLDMWIQRIQWISWLEMQVWDDDKWWLIVIRKYRGIGE